jgi:hypothetical protein
VAFTRESGTDSGQTNMKVSLYDGNLEEEQISACEIYRVRTKMTLEMQL